MLKGWWWWRWLRWRDGTVEPTAFDSGPWMSLWLLTVLLGCVAALEILAVDVVWAGLRRI